jgi:acetoin utilization protein AcuB
MFVRKYMTRNPITISPEATFTDAMGLLRKHKIRRLPVVDKGALVGIVVEKDLLTNQPSPATTLSVYEMYGLLERLHVRQMMSCPVITVGGDCPLEEAARIMVANKVSSLPVMEGEQLVGIITETDIFKALVEVLGGGEKGCRLVLQVPERLGGLAEVAGRIAEAGGNILAVVSSRLQDNATREMTVKESGADTDKLEGLLRTQGTTVLDIRPSAEYTPRTFG